jgi:hypothetical protein
MKKALQLLVAIFFVAGLFANVLAITVEEAQKAVTATEKALADAKKDYADKSKAADAALAKSLFKSNPKVAALKDPVYKAGLYAKEVASKKIGDLEELLKKQKEALARAKSGRLN